MRHADLFQSTLSMRRATYYSGDGDRLVHISIHALHEESDEEYRLTIKGMFISIHALHEESDKMMIDDANPYVISIHALHEESDWQTVRTLAPTHRFQSTLSMRRATFCLDRGGRVADFNPRSP